MPGLPSSSASASQGQQSQSSSGVPSAATTGSQSQGTGNTSGRESSIPGQSSTSAASSASNSGGSPTQSAGTDSRLPGDQQSGSGGRDSSTGDLNSGQSGNSGSSSSILRPSGGDYSLDTLPDGVLSGNSGPSASTGATAAQGTGAMTTAERTAALDEALRRGYETFDGYILGERERAQRESNEAGSVDIAGNNDGGGGGGTTTNQPQILNEGDATVPSGVIAATQPVSSGSAPAETFPPPEDIPSGRDDDVVARQIREAAMTEPDPELREALWNEYRNYTGIAEGNQ